MDPSEYLRVARALRQEADSTRGLARILAATTIAPTWWGLTRHSAETCLDEAVASLGLAVARMERAEEEARRAWREAVSRSALGGSS